MKTMKLMLGAITLGAVIILGNPAQAQRRGASSTSDASFGVGTMSLNIGIGAGRSSFGDYGAYSDNYYGYGSGFGFKVAAERGMWQLGPGVLSLGVEAGGSLSSGSLSGYKSNIFIAAVRSAYHFGWNVRNLDTYGGVSLGPGIRSYNYYDGTYNDTRHDAIIAPGIFVGASYYFTPRFGVNVEAGYDITVAQAGVIFKMN